MYIVYEDGKVERGRERARFEWEIGTYGSLFAGFALATLQRQSVTLMLETLRSDETLNARSLGVWLVAFTLGLDFTADDEFADLDANCLSALTALNSPQASKPSLAVYLRLSMVKFVWRKHLHHHPYSN